MRSRQDLKGCFCPFYLFTCLVLFLSYLLVMHVPCKGKKKIHVVKEVEIKWASETASRTSIENHGRQEKKRITRIQRQRNDKQKNVKDVTQIYHSIIRYKIQDHIKSVKPKDESVPLYSSFLNGFKARSKGMQSWQILASIGNQILVLFSFLQFYEFEEEDMIPPSTR